VTKEDNENQETNIEKAVDISLQQLNSFFDILQSLEQKVGIFVGFSSAIIAVIIGFLFSGIIINTFEFILLLIGIFLLFISIFLFIMTLQSKTYRNDPEINSFVLKYSDKSTLDFNKQLVVNINNALDENSSIINKKAKYFKWGIWFLFIFLIVIGLIGLNRLCSNYETFIKKGGIYMTNEDSEPVIMPAVDNSVIRRIDKSFDSANNKLNMPSVDLSITRTITENFKGD
jgi:hypothetical protein